LESEKNAPQYYSDLTEHFVVSLLVISTIVDLALTIYFLSQGTTIVFQNVYYFTIVLAAYWYKWRGAFFSSGLSVIYLGLSAYYDPQFDQVSQAIIRTVIFILIALVVAYLSTKMENERRRYHTIFSKAESGMVAVLTDDLRIKEANGRFREITGEDKVEGKDLELFFNKKDIGTVNAHVRKAEDFSDLEMKIRSASGEERTCLVSGSHIGPHEMVMSLTDVTGRHLIERTLRENEEKFREIFNDANDAIYLNEWNPDSKPGVFVDVNEAARLMLGYSREELLRMTPADLVSHVQQSESWETSRHLGKEGMGRFEEVHQRRDGSAVPVEINAHLIKIGGHQMVLAVVRDITDRKKAEEERRLNEETMRLVVTSAPFPLIIANWDGTYILDANSQAMEAFGLVIEQGQKLSDLFVDRTDLEIIMATLVSQGSVDGMEVALLGKDGERRWHILSARPISYPGEQRLLLATHDITERRKMEKALHVANLKLGMLNSITRHDILNQMTVLNGFIELGKRREKDPIIAPYLDKMSQAADNVQRQIAFTKDYQDMGLKAPAWVSVSDQMAEAFKMLHPNDVTMEDVTGGVEILADLLAEKVPYNLIDNSMRHGEGVSHIKLSAEQTGKDMLIVYQDNGIGISEEVREHLFQKGFGKNTGLGLFLIREILAITGITIEEKGQCGHGVRFEMLVPAGVWRHSRCDDLRASINKKREPSSVKISPDHRI
jgi:PAS domain S-box-containing protein